MVALQGQVQVVRVPYLMVNSGTNEFSIFNHLNIISRIALGFVFYLSWFGSQKNWVSPIKIAHNNAHNSGVTKILSIRL